MTSFEELVRRATSGHHGPYPWQEAVAAAGLPELIAVETGAGKTEGVVLPWLYRRRYHADLSVRESTPRWLVLCLPLRVLTEQTERLVRGWLQALDLDNDGGVAVHVAMGGRAEGAGETWRRHPERDAVVIGTVDMLLSRALNRGYAMSRFNWPIDFGLLHSGCQWVFDEVQLLGPALPTSRQLEAFRRKYGCPQPSRSTWMSATVDEHGMVTVDSPEIPVALTLGPADRSGGLARRLGASRRVEEVHVEAKRRDRDLASVLLAAHLPATLTVAVVNTVDAAKALHNAVIRADRGVPVSLIHSRFRPPERRQALERALAAPPDEGHIVVATQVLEAGVDLSATTMLIEAAPWPSVVQRAGRCNRDGLCEMAGTPARLLWTAPTKGLPYADEDVAAAVSELRALEGVEVTATSLRDRSVHASPTIHPVLRATDLLGLFDTAPDLSGNDIDIGPYLRAADDRDIYLAWRDLGAQPPSLDESRPTGEELCPVPLGPPLRDLAARTPLWRYDHLASAWDQVRPRDLRAGMVLIADTHAGAYDPTLGWEPSSRRAVTEVAHSDDISFMDQEESIAGESGTYKPGRWVRLQRHLVDVEAAATELLDALRPSGLDPACIEASIVAGRLHDIGKAHPTFQDTMVRSASGDSPERRLSVETLRPWAKSGGSRARHRSRYFRHELASALMLLGAGSSALDGVADPHLVVYLVGAHHGRVRLGIRSVPAEEQSGTVLGIRHGDRIPEVDVPGGTLPATTLSLDVTRLGSDDNGADSWSGRSLDLLERLGPFRLAFLEAVVRLADWRASADEAIGEGDL